MLGMTELTRPFDSTCPRCGVIGAEYDIDTGFYYCNWCCCCWRDVEQAEREGKFTWPSGVLRGGAYGYSGKDEWPLTCAPENDTNVKPVSYSKVRPSVSPFSEDELESILTGVGEVHVEPRDFPSAIQRLSSGKCPPGSDIVGVCSGFDSSMHSCLACWTRYFQKLLGILED